MSRGWGHKGVPYLRQLRKGYRKERKGHRQRILEMMVTGFRIAQALTRDSAERGAFIKEAEIQEKGRAKPLNLVTEVMAYIASATSDSGRKLAWKRGRVLEFLREKGVDYDDMAATIKKYGGIEKAYQKAARAGPRLERPERTVSGDGLGIAKPRNPQHAGATPTEPKKMNDPRSNDTPAELTVRIQQSDKDKIREQVVGTQIHLKAVRTTMNAITLVRITDVSVDR